MDHNPLPSDVMSALEACRPGADDERLTEVAEILAYASPVQVAAVRRSLARVDRAIMGVIDRVPLPDGLAERLLDRLAIAQQEAAEAGPGPVHPLAEPAEAPAPYGELPAKRTGAKRTGAKRTGAKRTGAKRTGAKWTGAKWLMAGGGAALALAASLLIAMAVWPRENMPLAEMQTEVRALFEADHQGAVSASGSLPSDADPAGLGGVSTQWVIGCHAIELLDRHGYAYELAQHRARGTLYVVPLKSWRGPTLSGLGAQAVVQSTSGTTVAAWTDETNAYFLVAKGDGRAIATFFPRRMA
jgi:hypothetical protein